MLPLEPKRHTIPPVAARTVPQVCPATCQTTPIWLWPNPTSPYFMGLVAIFPGADARPILPRFHGDFCAPVASKPQPAIRHGGVTTPRSIVNGSVAGSRPYPPRRRGDHTDRNCRGGYGRQLSRVGALRRHDLRAQMFSRAREIERHFPSISICRGRKFFVLMSDWFGSNEGFLWLRTLSFSTTGFEVRIFSSCLAILWFAHKYR